MNYEIEFKHSFTFSNENIADLLTTALEGGSNYWIGTLFTHGDTLLDTIKVARGDSTWEVQTDDDDEKVKLTAQAMRDGLQALAEKSYVSFKNIQDMDYDAIDADNWLQLTLFQEIVYG